MAGDAEESEDTLARLAERNLVNLVLPYFFRSAESDYWSLWAKWETTAYVGIVLRFFDRDTHPDLTAELRICGGARVPVVVFLSEDWFEVGRYGDRTLAKYRQLAADMTGPACPTAASGSGRRRTGYRPRPVRSAR